MHPVKGLFRSSRRLSLVGVALVIVTLVAAGLAIWDLREDVIANYREDIGNLGVVLGEQTTRSLQAVDLVVQETREKVLATGVETPEQFNRLMATEDIHQFLHERLKNLPQADAIILIGAEGRVTNFSRSWPIPPIDLADREHYAYLRDHDDLGAYISEPVKNRATGTWTVYLSRRVDGPHGEFLGAVLGAIELRYFEDFYKAIALQNDGAVTVLRRDGTILARYPIAEDQISKKMPPESPWYARVAADGGTYRSPAYLDGIVRVVSVHPLREYPLVIDVTVSEEAALAHWRRESIAIAMGALCTIIGFVVLIRMLAVQFRRLEDRRVQIEGRTSELVRVAGALRESEGEFARKNVALTAILREMPDGVQVFDREGQFVAWNEQVFQLVDLDAEQRDKILAAPDRARAFRWCLAQRGDYGPGDPAELVASREATARAGKATKFRRQSASGRWLEVRGGPTSDGGWLGFYRDVSEEVAREQELRHKSAILQAMLDHFPAGISVTNQNLDIVIFNRQFLDLLDLPAGRFAREVLPLQCAARRLWAGRPGGAGA
jgi:PAS domain-containing protein